MPFVGGVPQKSLFVVVAASHVGTLAGDVVALSLLLSDNVVALVG